MNTSYPLARGGVRAQAPLWERPSAPEIDRAVQHVGHYPKSVRRLVRWALEHPGPHSVDEIRRGCGLSVRTIKTASHTLMSEGMAQRFDTWTRSGHTAVWIYYGAPLLDLSDDLGTVQKARSEGSWHRAISRPLLDLTDSEIARCQDRDSMPATCGNGAESGAREGARRMKDIEGPGSSSEDQGVPLSPAVVAAPRRSAALDEALWSDETRDEHPVLAAYLALLDRRDFTLLDRNADEVWLLLATFVENKGRPAGLDLIEHLGRSCLAPYSPVALKTFIDRWSPQFAQQIAEEDLMRSPRPAQHLDVEVKLARVHGWESPLVQPKPQPSEARKRAEAALAELRARNDQYVQDALQRAAQVQECA